MLASQQLRRRPRRPRLTPTRIATGLAAILVFVLAGRLLVSSVAAGAYIVLVLVTMFLLRGVRAEPGTWLSRRAVRRGLVIAMGAVCATLVAAPAPGSPSDPQALLGLFVVLVLLNVALGRATQRVATAVDSTVDERQEALRNRAHRVAYVLLAGLGVAALICDAASTQSRSWLGASLGGGGLLAAAELLFVLPAMVLAFLEPARIPPDGELIAPVSTRTRVAAWLLAATIAIPLLLSIALVFLPEQLSASSTLGSDGRQQGSAMDCRDFFATRTIGVLVVAEVPLRARACWDGNSASESFGLNSSDCVFGGGVLTSVRTVSCKRVTDSRGTLSFTYEADVSPMLLPFLHRDVSMHLRIDRNGNVEQFP